MSMVVDHGIARGTAQRYDERQGEESAGESPDGRLWCYLARLRGDLYAIPDEESAVLMPYINHLGGVTPLPLGLAPPYVMGLVGVNGYGEVLVDLAAYVGLPGEPPAEGRRLLVIGERASAAPMPYRLAFAVDAGYGLAHLDVGDAPPHSASGGAVRALIPTERGEAALLEMEAVCRAIIAELGAERPWNAPAALPAPRG